MVMEIVLNPNRVYVTINDETLTLKVTESKWQRLTLRIFASVLLSDKDTTTWKNAALDYMQTSTLMH